MISAARMAVRRLLMRRSIVEQALVGAASCGCPVHGPAFAAPTPVEWHSLRFEEASDFLRQKLRLPTERWTDIWEGQHTRAFVVAGAQTEKLLSGFQQALQQAIDDGTTIETFRKEYDRLRAENPEWIPKGGREWRSRVIFQTNLQTAYSAGRYKQMTDPAVLAAKPFWRYRHSDAVRSPRLQHLAWNGLVLRADDPFWNTHYPPNGWGCMCWVEALSARELQALGKSGPDEAPPIDLEPRIVNTAGGPVTIQVPKGIDPGWGYNVGRSAWGTPPELVPPDAAFVELPGITPSPVTAPLPLDPLPVPLGPPIPRGDVPGLRQVFLDTFDGSDVTLTDPTGADIRLRADTLIDQHFKKPRRWTGRERFLPLLKPTIEDPAEIWASFAQAKNGAVIMRRKYARAFDIGGGRTVAFIASAEEREATGLGADESAGREWRDVTYYTGDSAAVDEAVRLRSGKRIYDRGNTPSGR